jgi:preprotein translocase subunit SecY
MLANIANTFANCFKIPELRSRIFYTIAVLAICRVVALIRIPGIDGIELARFLSSRPADSSSLLGLYNSFTGFAMEKCAIGALGIMPYISATIIIQLLTAVVPQLSKLAREEGGRTKLIQYGRYFTVVLCVVQGYLMTLGWEHPDKLFGGDIGKLILPAYSEGWMIWVFRFQTVLLLTTGTMLLMWLGEQITERGIGNGISLVITIGILAGLPQAAQGLLDMFFGPQAAQSKFKLGEAAILLVILAVVIASVIAVTQAQRKIPVQYAQRAVGRKVFAGGTSFMPLKVNYAGVMPIIFASAILMFPQKIFQGLAAAVSVPFLKSTFTWLEINLNHGAAFYLVVYSLMILFFSYFWVATQFNELQISDDLKKNGGYIPGVRPGQATCDYLHHAMTRITLAGAVFLVIVAVIPTLLYGWLGIPAAVGQFFGGTSMLITVGVVLDTMRQMESHLLMRHYDGFLKKGRVKGRF